MAVWAEKRTAVIAVNAGIKSYFFCRIGADYFVAVIQNNLQSSHLSVQLTMQIARDRVLASAQYRCCKLATRDYSAG